MGARFCFLQDMWDRARGDDDDDSDMLPGKRSRGLSVRVKTSARFKRARGIFFVREPPIHALVA